MHKLLVSLSLTALLIPVVSFAQENQPQPGVYCPHLTRDLKFRDSDATTQGQVTELQRFLADYYDDYPSWAITGNFRGTTLSFVQRFQKEQNLPAFGYVGPLTRAAIQRVCGTTTSPLPPPVSFSASPTSGTAPLTVSFRSNVGYEHTILFGDGQSGLLNSTPSCATCAPIWIASHTYSSPGMYTAKLVNNLVDCATGNCWVTTTTITVSPVVRDIQLSPPTVSLTINGQQNVTMIPGSTFTLAWSSSNATSCNLTNAQGQTSSTPPNVADSSQGAAPAAGQTFTYTLSCTNSGGTTTKSAVITGAAAGSTGSLTATPMSGTAPLTVAFKVTNAPISTGSIDYGDGSPLGIPVGAAACQSGVCGFSFQGHIYTSPGTYTARAFSGSTALGTATITVTSANVGACTYKGTTYQEGQSVTIPNQYSPTALGQTAQCDNGTWLWTNPNESMAAYPINYGSECLANNTGEMYCGGYQTTIRIGGMIPRHGKAPFSTSFKVNPLTVGSQLYGAETIDWGDGTPVENQPQSYPTGSNDIETHSHTYSSPGAYTMHLTQIGTGIEGNKTGSANIRIDGPVASAQNQSQLASALTALESALKALLHLLGR